MVGACTCFCFAPDDQRYFSTLATYLVTFVSFEQLRRQARLRREYLYRKSAEEKERSTYERKKKLKTALEGLKNSFACTNTVYLNLIRSLSRREMTTSIFKFAFCCFNFFYS